ncbi:hypothetical protein C1X69_14330 [Pseudomonas sp. FW305-67]|nr:hypothetical protein C1X70_12775 [Pseudomonas sp. FW305-53]PMY87036.1 hypothetical protein C1X68_11675 [Pseudomonas sp. FW303-C2]PMY92640.1 hypothetical protein C1X67_12440 [Pseudomonas sp. FW305-62]PNA45823.1 hypothetical protein C1X71_03810 [Pseudomonas sp. FW306-2-2C-A10BC]PNA88643.1 hypothetical protein C1X66_04365 [Pseudomonas sp. MPR-R3B]PNB20523.1 hypothetical protein C1X69_14330 [Pseudomonas sp. FW305-67]
MFSCSESEQKQLNTWVSFQSAEQPLLGQFSVSGNRVSLYAVSAHDVVAGHALLRGAGGILLNENGESIYYLTEANMQTVSRRCFGGSEIACRTLVVRDWNRIFTAEESQA